MKNSADLIKSFQIKPRSTEEILLEDLLRDFDNGDPRTRKNLSFIAIRTIEEAKYDQVMRICSEVKADSNANTKSKTAVFIDRCLEELKLKSSGEGYTALDKWLYKALFVTEKDLLCNTDMFLEMGRYEKKVINKAKIVFNNDTESFLEVLFEISSSQHDTEEIKEALSKPFGKLEVLLEMAIHREFIKQYAKLSHSPEESLLKYDEIKTAGVGDVIFKRPYIVLPTSTIREWVWGDKNNGNIKRAEDTFLRFNRERLILNISEGRHLPEGLLKLKRYKDSIRPYEIEVIKLEIETTQGLREATGYKIMMHEFFFETLIQLHQANKYKPDMFEQLRELSEREIKLYLLLSKFDGMDKAYLHINEKLITSLGIDLKSPTKTINLAVRRSVENLNKKLVGVSIYFSKDQTKILMKK